jgi:hypothetical protein
MSTGNDMYLEHLRGELIAALDDVTPPAAPTAAVKRKGKAIRNRRRVGVAAGLAVAIIAAVLVPGLLRQPKAQVPVTPEHKNPKVTVSTIGRSAQRGLIAQGAIDGKPWRITLHWMDKNLCVGISAKSPNAVCEGLPDRVPASWPVALEGTGDGRVNEFDGIASGQVRRVSITLSDGVVLELRPVWFAGRSWIGVELPAKLAVTRAVAYSRTRELAYAVPFIAVRGDLPTFVDWLRPNEPVPGEIVREIGSGVSAGRRWSVTVHVGPWGVCAVPVIAAGAGTSTGCWSASVKRYGVLMSGGLPAQLPLWAVGAARPSVSYLLLTMTDGSTRRVRVVQVGNVRLYAVVITNGPRIAHWAAYDAAGHRLYRGQGAAAFT